MILCMKKNIRKVDVLEICRDRREELRCGSGIFLSRNKEEYVECFTIFIFLTESNGIILA